MDKANTPAQSTAGAPYIRERAPAPPRSLERCARDPPGGKPADQSGTRVWTSKFSTSLFRGCPRVRWVRIFFGHHHGMEVIFRKDAAALGLVRYFTGKPCARGHVAERYVRSTDCVMCGREHRRRKVQNNLAHYRAKKREYSRRYRARKAPERRAQAIARRIRRGEASKALHAERLARRQERFVRWKAANLDRYRDVTRAWRRANRERLRLRKKRKQVRLRAELHKLQRGRCAYCRNKLTAAHLDHIQPLARGGVDRRSNLQLTCPGCNGAKSAKDPVDFARELGRLV